MKKLNNKGFTIVELVIVIAVIGILAGVLIPTFSGITASARQSAALQEAKASLNALLSVNQGTVAEGTQFVVTADEGKEVTYVFEFTKGSLVESTKIKDGEGKTLTQAAAAYCVTPANGEDDAELNAIKGAYISAEYIDEDEAVKTGVGEEMMKTLTLNGVATVANEGLYYAPDIAPNVIVLLPVSAS